MTVCFNDNYNETTPVILSVANAKRRIHFVPRDETTLLALLDPSTASQDDAIHIEVVYE